MAALVMGNIDALSDMDKKDRLAVFTEMCAGIIAHIQTAGIVNVTVAGTATGALAGGPGVPVVGTGTGTIT